MVGVNKYQMVEKKRQIDTLYLDRAVEKRQVDKLKALKARRNSAEVSRTLNLIKSDAKSGKNVMPSMIEAVKAYVTLQEACDALRSVYGEYREDGKF